MEFLLKRLGISIDHLKCLDECFRNHSELYQDLESKMLSELGDDKILIERMLYAGGKKRGKLGRQMILGDVIEYIFSGRIHYYGYLSNQHFTKFAKLILYFTNQLLLFDTITIYPDLRKQYIRLLEEKIPHNILYEREGDREIAQELKDSDILIWQNGWDRFDNFVDSILPKTLGCPKELVVFLELLRSKVGYIIPLLLIQRIYDGNTAIAPPDFLILKQNKEIFGIEVGYAKEGQSREFSKKTSIPTFAVDLANHMHNRCPKCGENLLYCDIVITKYADGTLWDLLDNNKQYKCNENNCPNFDEGRCPYANYYGKYKGEYFYGPQATGDSGKAKHYHANCVRDGVYDYRRNERNIYEFHKDEFFAQVPIIEGLDI